jgi:hypothetical protein
MTPTMQQSDQTYVPKLLTLHWLESRTRDGSMVCSRATYSTSGAYAYKREPVLSGGFVYHRILISRIVGMTYWYEIPAADWTPVDVHGAPR